MSAVKVPIQATVADATDSEVPRRVIMLGGAHENAVDTRVIQCEGTASLAGVLDMTDGNRTGPGEARVAGARRIP